MKYDSNRIFGYPVITDEEMEDKDYPNRKFSAKIILELNKEDFSKYTIRYDLKLDSETLNDLVRQGKASFVIRVKCNPTMFCMTKICSSSGTIDVLGNDLRDKVEIQALLIATEKLTLEDVDSEFHADYVGLGFTVDKGGVLAYPAPETYYIAKENFREITSIFEWTVRDDTPKDTFSVDVDEKRIFILAQKSQIQTFKEWLRNDKLKPFALNSFVLSAVTHAITELRKEDNQYEESHLANIIKTKCQNLNIVFEDQKLCDLEIAQKILHSPIKRLNSSMSGIGE